VATAFAPVRLLPLEGDGLVEVTAMHYTLHGGREWKRERGAYSTAFTSGEKEQLVDREAGAVAS
jgi:hypothetical protein